MITKILNGATALGACRKTNGITSAEQLVALFFSPQGREFCLKHNYPTLAMWREIKASIPSLEKLGFYIDAGAIELRNKENIAIIGQTRCVAKFDENNSIFHTIALHGAKATIKACNYAVFEAEADAASEVETIKDKTAIRL